MFRLCTNIIRNASDFSSSSISSFNRSTSSLVSFERSRSYATTIKRSKSSPTKNGALLKSSKSKAKPGLVKVKKSSKTAKSTKHVTKEAALSKVVKIADAEHNPEEGHTVKNLPLVNDHLAVPHVTEADRQHDLVQILRKFTDLREPHLWFPVARDMKRKIIIHAGPTNSGKTYHALQRLMQAESGTYCAPLRLLAHEVYDKLSAKGITANLITGQTVIKHNKAMHIACTMEMLDINKPIDVCVLDEYQMIGDATRGWAWTRALLGVPAKEIHLTGDESAIGLIRALAEQMNEEVEVRSYERLSPLVPASSPFSNYSTAKPGDAFIAFSRKELYSIKSSIERANTGAKCCLVYGDLPPETRAEQARLFNDPNSGYNVLVGTDAIGMGLNLNIRRIVFSKVEKFDGETRRPLKVSEVKQIAGRAGRYGSIYDKGVVTAMDKHALKYIRTKLLNETTPIHRAGIFPLFDQIAMFDQFSQKKLKFSEVLEYFMKVASISNKYFLCKTRDMVGVAKALDNMTLAIKDRYVFCMAPVDTKNPTVLYYLIIFAKQFSRGIVPWTLKSKKLPDMAIEELETMYKVSELYIWLSYRFEAEFTGQARAIEYKTKCKELIGKKLMQMKAKKSHIVNNKFRI